MLQWVIDAACDPLFSHAALSNPSPSFPFYIIHHLEALVKDTHNIAMIMLQKLKKKGFLHDIFFFSVTKYCFGLGTGHGSYSKKCPSRLYIFKDYILWAYCLSMASNFFQLLSGTPLPDTQENSNTLWWSGLNNADTDTGNVFQLWASFKMKNIFLAVPYWLSRMTVYSEMTAHEERCYCLDRVSQ